MRKAFFRIEPTLGSFRWFSGWGVGNLRGCGFLLGDTGAGVRVDEGACALVTVGNRVATGVRVANGTTRVAALTSAIGGKAGAGVGVGTGNRSSRFGNGSELAVAITEGAVAFSVAFRFVTALKVRTKTVPNTAAASESAIKFFARELARNFSDCGTVRNGEGNSVVCAKTSSPPSKSHRHWSSS